MPKQRTFTVILEPEERGYSIHCPALPGCTSQGDTREEALNNIVEAIGLVLDVMKERGQTVLQETPEIISQEICEILKARAEDGMPLIVEATQVTVKI